ncbi:MAG: HEPN domain-containing protein [Gemmatimonadota bacterium]|nr:MAG: HEPN domain-containing protein [Gemmatimonadota bacterium]
MTDETKKLLEQGHDHFEGARILLNKGYPTDSVGLLLHQALGAYFKGLLAHLEIDPQENDDLITLFSSIIQKHREFKNFEKLCERVNGYYAFGKVPPDPLSKKAQEEMKTSLTETEKLIAKINEKLS